MYFEEITAPRPTRENLEQAYARIHGAIRAGNFTDAMTQWDSQRRETESWFALTYLHFSQDTTDAQYKAQREYADEMGPVVADFDTTVKKALLEQSAATLSVAAPHALALWKTDIQTFDPAIAKDLEAESRVEARYTELLASARIAFDGQTLNLSGLTPYSQSLDRSVRHRAATAHWQFFQTHGPELDAIFDQLVSLRSKMAEALGDASFTPLAYRRLRRVDYGPEQVDRYRREIHTHVTPLVARLMEERRKTNNWDTLYAWDEPLIDPTGNPTPAGDQAFLVAAAQEMFADIDSRLAEFYAQMRSGRFMDLTNRPTKAGGGFCTSFPTAGMPYIFANFNGTHHDIDVFTHEMGHAFQNFQSRRQPLIDFLWPTMEAAEIHSMSLEFLAYPYIGRLMGAGAARYRRMHLTAALEFLPYGACVDHFQHEVFANRQHSAAQRHEIWRTLESHYMPWRNWGDLSYPASGARWQSQRHIYCSPFYYIDYTLAQCAALQFWRLSNQNHRQTMDRYVELCSLGGSAPFTELLKASGLVSPFDAGSLESVVQEAARFLNAD